MLGVGLADRAIGTKAQQLAVADGREGAVVGEDMGATAQFAHEGLGVRKRHLSLGGMADVRDRQPGRGSLGFEVTHQGTAGSRGRLAEQCHIRPLAERDAPPVGGQRGDRKQRHQ